MDFSLTDAQQEAARLAGRLLDDDAADPWKELARAGLLGLALPADLGGDELGVMGTAAVLTEVGRRAVRVPALATLMTGILPVARWGDATLQRALLPAAAAGDLILTAALSEPSEPLPLVPRTTVTGGAGGTGGTGGTVSGVKVGVPFGAQARHVLVPVSFASPSPNGPGEGTGVVIIDPAKPGAHLTPTRSSAGAPECTLVLDHAPVEHVLGHADCLADLSGLAIAGACALADGALAAALDLTTDHVAERRQFGRPLAAFQSVAQQIADVYIASRTLHLATQAACWHLDQDRRAPVADDDVAVAGYWCAHEAPAAVRTCHHLHGGLGMDVSYPLHRFSALIGDLVRSLGGADYQLERLAC